MGIFVGFLNSNNYYTPDVNFDAEVVRRSVGYPHSRASAEPNRIFAQIIIDWRSLFNLESPYLWNKKIKRFLVLIFLAIACLLLPTVFERTPITICCIL